jgi:serine/threonine-protein kinase
VALAPGTRVGPYEVIAQIGAGGMGEVYRARDTKLNRDVALKILPEAFTLDGDRIARFRREAQVLASLNHPNIAAIYGFEDSGSTHALVLELVEGPTLADRIAKGPIPLDEALPIAKQIAEALEAAHEQGIIHRDLKPANIKLRDDGMVKVLDFGLAKAMEQISAISPALTASPTITTPAQMTGVGMILGTAAYMSPEQAKGRPADKRSDVWAFGCVLYEMLTGKRAFEGDDVADTLALVLRGEVDWRLVPPDVPAGVLALLRHCLAKDPRNRIAHISTALFVLHEAWFGAAPAQTSTAATLAAVRRRSRQWMIASLLVPIVVAGGMWVWLRYPTSNSVQPLRFEIPLPAGQAVAEFDRNIALAPDGTALVYVSGVTNRLMIRRFDRLQSEPLREVGGVRYPFFSPDGKWVGYFRNGELRKVSVAGGIAQTVCWYSGLPRGATWGPDDTIVFTTSDPSTGLLAVAGGGGEPQVLTKPDRSKGEIDHVTPSWLPDGRGVLFSVTAQLEDSRHLAFLDRRTGQYRVLIAGTQPEYVSSGHLVFVAQGALRAVPFDAASFTIRGNPESIEQVAIKNAFTGVADYRVSRTGMLVFTPPAASGQALGTRALVWVTREGKEEPIRAEHHNYTTLRLSPDDTRIALDVREQENHIWIWDVRRQTLTRLTDGTGDQAPVWTHDGRRIVFSSQRPGRRGLFWQFVDGTGTVEPVDDGNSARWPGAFSPDGNRLVVTEISGRDRDDKVSILSMTGDKKSTPLVTSALSGRSPDLSPDGHWIAYQSSGSDGVDQIYVRPFPDVDSGHWQITSSGGTHPIWGKNTNLHELFYIDNEGYLTAASFHTTPAFSVGGSSRVLQTPYFGEGVGTRGAVYDVTRDDQRFVMIKADESGGIFTRLVAVVNWTEELKQRVPSK